MKPILAAYVVRIANGSRRLRAAGFAAIAVFPNIFMPLAEHFGTHLTHAENVRAAIINGVGHRACHAANGLCTKIGMRKESEK